MQSEWETSTDWSVRRLTFRAEIYGVSLCDHTLEMRYNKPD